MLRFPFHFIYEGKEYEAECQAFPLDGTTHCTSCLMTPSCLAASAFGYMHKLQTAVPPSGCRGNPKNAITCWHSQKAFPFTLMISKRRFINNGFLIHQLGRFRVRLLFVRIGFLENILMQRCRFHFSSSNLIVGDVQYLLVTQILIQPGFGQVAG